MSTRLDPARWRRLTELFRASMDLSRRERRERIRVVRLSDPELARELETLLSAHDALDSSLDGGETFSVRKLGALDPSLAAALLEESGPARLESGATVGPYRVVRRLGRGGMGEVYLAEDPRLDRRVALKLLPPWLAADDLARRRFTAEARAASSLDHPCITTIYEIDETPEGRVYIAMAYYEGETLAERIARGPLPVDEAVTLGRQIASGLAAAHQVGIVHRDVKPSNVALAADGAAKLLDFGVAKVRGSRLTRDGAVPGTAAYMSPEQTRGEPCGPRSDLWSLGVVLHEMLTGERPFRAEAGQALVYAIRNDEPPALRDLRPGAPADLDALLARLLSRDPDDRPASAHAVAEELGDIAAGTPAGTRRRTGGVLPRIARLWGTIGLPAALGIVGLVAAAFLFSGGHGADDTTAITSRSTGSPSATAASPGRLAVLPLTDPDPEGDGDFFAAGLTAELVARLGRLPRLTTVAYSSSRRFEGSELSPAEIGEQLGARTLLEGSVRRSGGRVRIALQLVDAASGEETWSEVFESDLEDVLDTQEAIARRVASALRIELSLVEITSRRRTDDPDAYLTYLEARYHWDQRTPAGLGRAKELYEATIDRDPVFADAWAGLANTYVLMGTYGMMPAEDAFARARAAAERALAVDPDLAEAHTALANTLTNYFWDWDEAERRYRRAIELRPAYAPAHYWLSELLAHRGRTDEAIALARRAQELDPLSRLARADEGRALYQARRFDEAIRVFDRTLEDGPNFVAFLYEGLSHMSEGNLDEAVATLEEGREAYPRIPTATALLAHVYGRTGRDGEAESLLRELLAARESGSPVAAVDVAAVHLGLGQVDRAFSWLGRAIEERNWQVVFLDTEPLFDPIRTDPRFAALLERVEPLEPTPR